MGGNLVSHTKRGKWIDSVREQMLRRIFGPKRVEVAGDWRKLHNGKLHDLYTPKVIKMIKSRLMR
jgi:hypothetical protein